MYVYFDRTGTIKEIISEPIRQGSSSNKIYVYFEGGDDIDGLWWVEKKSNGDIAQPETMTILTETKALPYDLIKDRDLKYFKDYEIYKFWVITLQSANLNVDGLTLLTIRAMVSDEIYAQGLLTFEIEDSVINYDNLITQSQYDYLLQMCSDVNGKIGYVELDPSEDNYTITDEQLAEINKDMCMIKLGSWWYLKTDDDERPDIKFTLTNGYNVSGGILAFAIDDIIVDIENKTYTLDSGGEFYAYKKEVIDRLFPSVSTTTTLHQVGELTLYNGVLYKCVQSYTGKWDATKWQTTSLSDFLLWYKQDIIANITKTYSNTAITTNILKQTTFTLDEVSKLANNSSILVLDFPNMQEKTYMLRKTGETDDYYIYSYIRLTSANKLIYYRVGISKTDGTCNNNYTYRGELSMPTQE